MVRPVDLDVLEAVQLGLGRPDMVMIILGGEREEPVLPPMGAARA
jgi:hypothetical protein